MTKRKRRALCPTCKQDMNAAPRKGGIDCPQCGQGISKRKRRGIEVWVWRCRCTANCGQAKVRPFGQRRHEKALVCIKWLHRAGCPPITDKPIKVRVVIEGEA